MTKSHKPRPVSDLCKCGQPRRPGANQHDCYGCHRDKQARYRGRIAELVKLGRAVSRGTSAGSLDPPKAA